MSPAVMRFTRIVPDAERSWWNARDTGFSACSSAEESAPIAAIPSPDIGIEPFLLLVVILLTTMHHCINMIKIGNDEIFIDVYHPGKPGHPGRTGKRK
jgi:hypothetical protein